ncbi:ATP-binding protein [Streptomyces griseus]|uniref:hypothetical protein n=1 Tax=Streptomyces griseus TaxID=1911 RepID=UPI0038285D0D
MAKTAFTCRDSAVPLADGRTAADVNTGSTTIRIEVTDTRTERVPVLASPAPDAEADRGPLLVAALATHWGTTPHVTAPGKTVWAEISTPPDR